MRLRARELSDQAGAAVNDRRGSIEEVRRGGLGELVDWAGEGIRGEITIVVQGADAGAASVASDPDSLRAAVAELEADGITRKDAIVEVAKAAGLPKREVYDVVHKTQST